MPCPSVLPQTRAPCEALPRPCIPELVSGVCHRARPFHTKHPVGKTHNFYTTQSRWSRRPFEVLFVGHLQAFLITGSLRGASLSPGFCLPGLGGEGGSLGLHSAWRAPCQSPGLGLTGEGCIQAWDSVPLGILIPLGHPLCPSILEGYLITWRLWLTLFPCTSSGTWCRN